MKNKLNIPVEEYTTPSPLTIGPEASIPEIKALMEDNGIRHLPVLEKGRPIGIISDRDVRILSDHASDKPLVARDLMTPGPLTIRENVPLHKAAFELSQYKIGSALVVDEQENLVGIFTSTDALNALVEIARNDYEA